MLRHHWSKALCAAASLLFLVGCSSAGTPKHEPGDPQARANIRQTTPLLLLPLRALIRRHRAYGTHLDGNRCPMFPSCAAYGEQAIEQLGFRGLLLLIDRLFYREVGALENKYLVAPRQLSEHKRYFDPLADSATGSRPSLLKESFYP